MFKHLTAIGIILATTSVSFAGIVNTLDLVNHMKSLDNDKLEKFLLRSNKTLSLCSFTKAISSKACQYRVSNKAGTVFCFNNHPTLAVLAVTKTGWNTATDASGFPTIKHYMDNVRSMALSHSNARDRAINYVRSVLLASPSVCGITMANYQPSISKTFDDFTIADVTFTKTLKGKGMICSTAKFSQNYWNATTCSYTQKKTYLHPDTCKALYNKFGKSDAVSVNAISLHPVSFVPFTEEIAKDHAISLLADPVVSSLPEAGSNVALFDGISPEVLAVGELDSTQIAAAAVDSTQKPLLAQFHKYVTSAQADSAVEIPTDAVAVKDLIGNYAPIVTLAASSQVFDAVPYRLAKQSVLEAVDASVLSAIKTTGIEPVSTSIFNVTTKCAIKVIEKTQLSAM